MITLFKHVRRLCIHIVGNVKFLADDRLYSVLTKHGHERMHAVHIAVIGDRDGVHPPCFKRVAKRVSFYGFFRIVRMGRDLQKAHRTVQQTVFRMQM